MWPGKVSAREVEGTTEVILADVQISLPACAALQSATGTTSVVRSFYRQKPRRQHLCIVERLLDYPYSIAPL